MATSKPRPCQCCGPPDGVKTRINTHWNIRNNSSKVAAALQPDLPCNRSQMCLISDCYCIESPVAPLLAVKKSHSDDDDDEPKRMDVVYRSHTSKEDSPSPDNANNRNVVQGGDHIKRLSDFRKEHYFETHSTDDLLQHGTVGEHKCVHRFELDKDGRLLPLDGDDKSHDSRCAICGKLMANPKPTILKDERLGKFYRRGVMPRVYLGRNNVRIHVQDKYGWAQKFTKPNYFNTYALRFQRGVV